MKVAKKKPGIIFRLFLPVMLIAFFWLTLFPVKLVETKIIFSLFCVVAISLFFLPLKQYHSSASLNFKEYLKKFLILLFYGSIITYNLIELPKILLNKPQVVFSPDLTIFPWGLIIIISLSLSFFIYYSKKPNFYSSTVMDLFKLKTEEDLGIYINFCSRLALLVSFSLLIMFSIICILQVSSQISQVTITPPFTLSILISGTLFVLPIVNSKKTSQAMTWLAKTTLPANLQYFIIFICMIFLMLVFYYATAFLADFFPAMGQPLVKISPETNFLFTQIFQFSSVFAFTVLVAGIFSYQLRAFGLKKQIILLIAIAICACIIAYSLSVINNKIFERVLLIILDVLMLLSLVRNRWLWYFSRGRLPTDNPFRQTMPDNFLKGITNYASLIVAFYYFAGIPLLSSIVFLSVFPMFFCYCYGTCSLLQLIWKKTATPKISSLKK